MPYPKSCFLCPVTIAEGQYPFPSRTRKSSPPTPMILRKRESRSLPGFFFVLSTLRDSRCNSLCCIMNIGMGDLKENERQYCLLPLDDLDFFCYFFGGFFRSYFFMRMNMRNSFIEALIFFLVAEAFVAYHAFMK